MGTRTRPASLEDVAQRAGVSTATVSRAINNPEKVLPATAEKVRAAIEFLDYRPNQFAAGLITRSSRVIGVVVADDFTGVTGDVLKRCEDEARRMGFHLLLVSASRLMGGDEARGSAALGMLDAVVVLIEGAPAAVLGAAESLGVPVVSVGSGAGASANADGMNGDHAAAAVRQAMQLALDRA